MPATQSFKSHARFDPFFHFFLSPIALTNLILSITYTIRQWPIHSRSHLWWIVMSLFFFVAIFKIRTYALQNQDRIIRLEERLRYATLLDPATNQQALSLTLRQIIALRFASDSELPNLISRTLAESLEPKQIKQAITAWRPDETRI